MTFDGGIKDWMAGLEQVGESGPLQSAVWWVPSSQLSGGSPPVSCLVGPLQSAVWWDPSSQRSGGSPPVSGLVGPADCRFFFVIFILKRPHSAVNNPYIFLAVTVASLEQQFIL